MTAEYASQAMLDLYSTVAAGIAGAQLSGIIGDAAHNGGYHRGAGYVSSGDYSVQLSADLHSDGQVACGLDLSWTNAADQYAVSQRLLSAAGDPRMMACREFYGSVDGWNVCGWDYAGGYPVTSDDSHLWHVHLSVLRDYALDAAAMQNIASVITGAPTNSGGFLMALTDQQQSDMYHWLQNLVQQHGIEAVRNVDDGAVYVLTPRGWAHVNGELNEWFSQMRMYAGSRYQDITTGQLANLMATMGQAPAGATRMDDPDPGEPSAS